MAEKQRLCGRSRSWGAALAAACLALPAAAQDTAQALPGEASSGGESVSVAAPGPDPVVLEVRDSLPGIPTVDLVSEPADIWERLRNGFAMPELDSPLVTQQQAWYLSHPQTLARIVERSRRYLFHIVEEIERRGLPTELALLPMVESAYDPMALSPARASGLWQFIPETGRNYRLRQNWWADERRDILASTSAALEYLRDIYEMNGDWHLALASYNWGENAVARAVERNAARGLPADYLSLPMPAETRNYVPKLQALKNIVSQPQLFGITLDPIPNRPYFETVEKPADMDIALAARLAEVPLAEFRALNPAYNRPVASGPARLVLPAGKREVFLANLAQYDKPLLTWQTYTLRKGDRLDRVARRFGIALAQFKEVNGISARMRLAPGHSLLVPARDPLSAAESLEIRLPPDRAVASARAGRLAKAAAKSPRSGLARAAPARPAAKHARAVAKPLAKAARPAKRAVVALKPAGRAGHRS